MRTIRIGALALIGLLVVAGALLPAAPAGRASAQTGEAVVRVTPPPTQIKKGDKRVPFEINAENVTNLAGFQFDLTYNASVFELLDAEHDAEKGDFIGSTGRPVVCNPPVVDTGAGVTRFVCVTLAPTPKGADGSGKLATIYLHAKGSGSTDVVLKSLKLTQVADASVPPTDPRAAPEITVRAVDATVTVAGGGGGINWAIWGPVIAVVILIVAAGGYAAMKMRGGRANTTAVA